MSDMWEVCLLIISFGRRRQNSEFMAWNVSFNATTWLVVMVNQRSLVGFFFFLPTPTTRTNCRSPATFICVRLWSKKKKKENKTSKCQRGCHMFAICASCFMRNLDFEVSFYGARHMSNARNRQYNKAVWHFDSSVFSQHRHHSCTWQPRQMRSPYREVKGKIS